MRQLKDPWGFRIVYKSVDDNETISILAGIKHTSINISGLLPNSRYTFWIMGLTRKGFGVPSQAVNITTGHKGDIFLKSLSLLSVFMLPRVGAVKHVGKSRRFCRKRLLEKNGS